MTLTLRSSQAPSKRSSMAISTPLREVLRKRPILSKRPELFRAVDPGRVLSCFAQVFASGVTAVAAAGTHVGGSRASSKASARLDEQLLESGHADGDVMFYACQEVDQVAVFISHVWSAARWLKALALYYYMNMETAVIASIVSWVLTMIGMVSLHGPTGMGGREGLLRIFVGIPMLVFAVSFFMGHKLRVPVQTVWLDKFCIHQTRDDHKVAGVTALPEVVASSKRMLVLWNSTYFERLWCNAEVATFAALNDGVDNMDIMPLWLTPWMLVTIAFDIVAIYLSSELFVLIPLCGQYFAQTEASQLPGLATFLALFVGVGTAFTLSYCPLLLVTWHALRFKLDIHEQMLKQCSEYKLSSAKCTVESDRVVVEGLVQGLFHEADDPIMEFNSCVNDELTNHIAARVGHATYIPYRQCLLLFLPLAFSAAVNVWGCDDMPCEMAAEAELGEGAIPAQQMITNAIAWAVGIFGIYPTVYPVMLAGLAAAKSRFQGSPCARRLAEVATMLASYTYMGFHEGFAAGVINTASQQLRSNMASAGVWLSCVFIYVLCLVRWNMYLFRLDVTARPAVS